MNLKNCNFENSRFQNIIRYIIFNIKMIIAQHDRNIFGIWLGSDGGGKNYLKNQVTNQSVAQEG